MPGEAKRERTLRVSLQSRSPVICHESKVNGDGVPTPYLATDKNMPFILECPGLDGVKMVVACVVEAGSADAPAAVMPTLTGETAVVRDGVAQFTRFHIHAKKAAYTSECNKFYVLVIQPDDEQYRAPERTCFSAPFHLTAKIRKEKRTQADVQQQLEHQLKRIKMAAASLSRGGGEALSAALTSLTEQANQLEQYVGGLQAPQMPAAAEGELIEVGAVPVTKPQRATSPSTRSTYSCSSEDAAGQLPGGEELMGLPPSEEMEYLMTLFPPAPAAPAAPADAATESEAGKVIVTFDELQHLTDQLFTVASPGEPLGDGPEYRSRCDLGDELESPSPFRGAACWSSALLEAECDDETDDYDEAEPDRYRSLGTLMDEPSAASDEAEGVDPLQTVSALSRLLATISAKLKIAA